MSSKDAEDFVITYHLLINRYLFFLIGLVFFTKSQNNCLDSFYFLFNFQIRQFQNQLNVCNCEVVTPFKLLTDSATPVITVATT